MEPDKPPGLPQELWDRVLAYQQTEKEFRERKARFLDSLKTGNDRILDRALEQLTADEAALKSQGATLSKELRERFGLEL